MTMKKSIIRAAIAAPFVAATIGAPVAAFAAPAETPPAEDSSTISIPGADEIDLSDIGESSFEVTADWGDGEIITDATEGGDGTGDGEGEDITPESKDDGKAEAPADDASDGEAEAPAGDAPDEEAEPSEDTAKTEAPKVGDGSDSPADDAEETAKN